MTGVAVGAACVWLLVVAAVDARTRRIPDALAALGVPAAAAVAAATGTGWPALAGAAVLGAVYLVLRLVSPRSLGGGDLKIAPSIGALAASAAGTDGVLVALALPFVVTAVAGLALRMIRGARTVPHGPGLCLAAALVLLVGS